MADPTADTDPRVLAARRADFRRLHERGFFVLPNPWDAGSAKALASMGFRALATTSSGAAFSRGRPDGALTLDETLAHVEEIVAATALPVNADFEDGHAADLATLALNVSRCIAAGAAGVSIEDATGRADEPLYARGDAVERVRAARRAIDDSAADVLLVARAECFLTGHPQPLDEALARLEAYAEAGADVLYAPGVATIEDIARIVRAARPLPVNVLLRPGPFPSLAELEQAGVRRASVGGALAVAAWGGFLRAARRLQEGDGLVADADASHASLNRLFATPPRVS